MLQLLCPSCMIESSFSQYGRQEVNIRVSSEENIVVHHIDALEIDEDQSLICNGCDNEELPYVLREIAENYLLGEDNEEEDEDEEAAPIRTRERHHSPTGWEQVRPAKGD